jgi:hypothetical protein
MPMGDGSQSTQCRRSSAGTEGMRREPSLAQRWERADIVEEVRGYPSFLSLEPWIRREREVCRRRLVAPAAAGL